MPGRPRPERRPLTRAELPDQFTPETVRGLDVFTVRRLSQPGNGILTAEEQRAFDMALKTVMQDATDRLAQSLRRVRHGDPGGLDPQLRRSYARTEQRLAAQARRARQNFPQLTDQWDEPAALPAPAATDEHDDQDEHDDATSLGALESEIEQTSDTLEILERIASIQQQQLEHQRTQVLHDVRGVFFALLVSVAVIVAGVAPLVQAAPHERALIVLWTLVVVRRRGCRLRHRARRAVPSPPEAGLTAGRPSDGSAGRRTPSMTNPVEPRESNMMDVACRTDRRAR